MKTATTPKSTKEETVATLKKQLASAQTMRDSAQVANQEWVQRDQIVRKNLQQMLEGFGAYTRSYDIRVEQAWEWSRIYFEMGKLMERKAYTNILETITSLEHRVANLEPEEKP